MEPKNKLMKGASKEIENKFFKEFLNVEEKLTEVESEATCGVEEVGGGAGEGGIGRAEEPWCTWGRFG